MTGNPDYRLYLEERFEGMAKLMNAHFENTHERLERIEIQTTRTNGRVTELEKEVHEELLHTIDICPQRETIKEIHKAVIIDQALKTEKEKESVFSHSDRVRWIMILGIATSIVLSIVGNFLTNRNNQSVQGLKTEVDMINTPVRTRSGVIEFWPSGVVIDSLKKVK